MKIIKHLSRIIVGLTFMFSGFVKGIDPLGFAYKFKDYFDAMGLEWMIWASLPLAVILSLAEFAIGAALFFNVFLRFFSWLAILFMIFFTILTFWIAIKNPVTDCGCFGDALVISNWQTFYKNVVLIILAIIVFKYRNKMENLFSVKIAKWLSAMVLFGYLFCVYYSYNHLPIFNFRAYKTGVNIPQAMTVPPGAPQDEYKNMLYYKNKNSGEIKEFSEQNYPWQDTLNWEYSSMKSTLVKEGYKAPIHNFSMESKDGNNVLDMYLSNEGYVFMLIAYDLRKSSLKPQQKINTLAGWSIENGIPFVCLTATSQEDAQIFALKNGIPYEFFNCDEITLKTIIRSNPGLILIKSGTILGRWHYNDIPSPDEFKNRFLKK